MGITMVYALSCICTYKMFKNYLEILKTQGELAATEVRLAAEKLNTKFSFGGDMDVNKE